MYVYVYIYFIIMYIVFFFKKKKLSEDILVKRYEFPFSIGKGNLIPRVGEGNQVPFHSGT
jgi:hypothetical protein